MQVRERRGHMDDAVAGQIAFTKHFHITLEDA